MDKLSDSEQHLIECMDKIYSIAKIRFESTAQDIFSIERNLHGTYLANERAKINLISNNFTIQIIITNWLIILLISIVDCEKRFKGKKIKFLWKSAASGARVMQLEQDLAYCKNQSQQRIKREM